MRLLVSVACREEAAAALAGGADIIDAKDPTAGPLGAVSLAVLREIVATVNRTRPVTAALGDVADERALERNACAYAIAGAILVKIGFAGVTSPEKAATLLLSAVRGAAAGSDGRCGVIAVAYADARRVASPTPGALIEVAATTGAAGVLLDTANKNGSGLRHLFSPSALAAWVAQAHDARLLVALAGQLRLDDLGYVGDAGADIAGVRGAACEGGRTGRVTADNVRGLRMRCALPDADGVTRHRPSGLSFPPGDPADHARLSASK